MILALGRRARRRELVIWLRRQYETAKLLGRRGRCNILKMKVISLRRR